MRPALIISSLVLLVSGGLTGLLAVLFDDVVTSRYATYEDAVADDLFGRGWLPGFIPASATRIVTRNNVDLNTSQGAFRYDPSDTAAFLANLRPLRPDRPPPEAYADRIAEMADGGYRAWELENAGGASHDIDSGSFWVFFVNPREGHVLYDMWPVHDLR